FYNAKTAVKSPADRPFRKVFLRSVAPYSVPPGLMGITNRPLPRVTLRYTLGCGYSVAPRLNFPSREAAMYSQPNMERSGMLGLRLCLNFIALQRAVYSVPSGLTGI